MPGITRAHGRRHAQDKFYTHPEIAKACVDFLGDLSVFSAVVEPSAGNGAFLDPLAERHSDVQAFDITPEDSRIARRDWFTVSSLTSPKVLVIGNPPYGVKYSLATRFVNHAFSAGADTVAFILPKSFRKASVQKLITPNAHLVRELELPDKAFLLEGEPHHVASVFQVWEHRDYPRPAVLEVLSSPYVEFVKVSDEWDFAVYRVGGHAGKAVLPDTPMASYNYFLRNKSDVSTERVVAALNTLDFPGLSDCVGPRSLPKTVLVPFLNQAVESESL